jgi:4'-phosphopantetheinyl transferase
MQRSLLGDILARYSICKRLGVKNKDLFFDVNEYGKPILLRQDGICFNISHSANWVVCAIDNNTVGIDVEFIKPIDIKIAERFFSKTECFDLMNEPEDTRIKYFYMLWTLKESYIKAEGKGLSIPLNSFNIKINNDNIYAIRDHDLIRYNFYSAFLDSNVVYSICTLSIHTPKNIIWDIDFFIKQLLIME